MATTASNRVKLYATPEVKWYLADEWLNTGMFGGDGKISKILAQLNLKGDTTAFFEKTQNKDKTICFVHGNKYEKVFLRFFSKPAETVITKCIIPFYADDYDARFAMVEDETKYTFFDLEGSDFITPRFIQTRSTDGVSCREISDSLKTIKYCFEVDKFFGSKVNATLLIPNNKNSVKKVEDVQDKFFEILSSGNGKDIYRYYEEMSKAMPFPADYHIICIKTDNEDGKDENGKEAKNLDCNITDELVVENSKCKKFKITVDNKSITLYDNHDWYFETNLITIRNESEKINFSGKLAEFQLEELKPIAEMVKDIKRFISNNMWFAFEK